MLRAGSAPACNSASRSPSTNATRGSACRSLGGGTRNLGLFGRHLDVLAIDDEYAAAERELELTLAQRRRDHLRRVARAGNADIESLREMDAEHAAAMSARREACFVIDDFTAGGAVIRDSSAAV